MFKPKNTFWRITTMCVFILFSLYICFGDFQDDSFISSILERNQENNCSINLQLQEKKTTYLTVQTHVSPGWCRMQASALLSNISVVSLGFGENYSHAIRPRWILEYIERNHLDDSHVLVFMDGGDTFFTSGFTMQQAVRNFIHSTAATAKEFDQNAVMNGKATAPILFGAEENCWGADFWYIDRYNNKFCRAQYTNAYKRAGYAFFSVDRNLLERGAFKKLYINGGTFISRVWAFKKVAMVYHAKLNTRKDFWCDQSIWTSIFLESLSGKLCASDEKCVPPGLISLDYRNVLSLHPYGYYFRTRDNRPWSQSAIDNYIAHRNPPFPHFFNLTDNPHATPGIAHFPGWHSSYLSDIPRMLEKTAWVRESQRDNHSILQSTEYLRNIATVKVYLANGNVKVLKYSDVCSADKALNMKWLGMRQQKK